jgi:hypothetical protein
VAAFGGAVDFLHLAGFQAEGDELYMPQEAVDRAVLEVAGEQLSSALSNPYFGML